MNCGTQIRVISNNISCKFHNIKLRESPFGKIFNPHINIRGRDIALPFTQPAGSIAYHGKSMSHPRQRSKSLLKLAHFQIGPFKGIPLWQKYGNLKFSLIITGYKFKTDNRKKPRRNAYQPDGNKNYEASMRHRKPKNDHVRRFNQAPYNSRFGAMNNIFKPKKSRTKHGSHS